MAIPSEYFWLKAEPSPRILREALALYGVREAQGDTDNQVILGWAKEIGGWVEEHYQHDEIPWCGLFVGICAKRAGFAFDGTALGAKNWKNWGAESLSPALGDVMIFDREGGGHVALYIGEDDEHYHVLGGNQKNEVNITRKPKSLFEEARRCKWKIIQPYNVRSLRLHQNGSLMI